MNLPNKKENQLFESLIPSIESSWPAWKIWKLMKSSDRKFLPVIDAGEFLGVVRGTDISMLASLNPGNLDITDIIDKAPTCVYLDSPLGDVVESLSSGKVDYVVLKAPSDEVLEIFNVSHVLSFVNSTLPNVESSKTEQLYEWRLNNGDN